MTMQFVFLDVRLQLDVPVEETVYNVFQNFCKFEALTFTGISEELPASFIRVKVMKISIRGTHR
jgi:hypothetical protein